ncbi:MAG TPA: molybdenum cofactor guanylyltransferase MobA [Rhodanobacteraceae bacterium]|nr:molybdenum cofactor guanylyltransferase MobA [Rhodanobacteraceae bacterium]
MTIPCLGVILAGGAGTRVGGADKGLLPLRGRPLIAHVLDALQPQCGALLIVANRNFEEYSRFAPAISDEREGHSGPLAGIVAALAYALSRMDAEPREWMMTVPVDCPRPPSDLRERLQSVLTKSGAASCAFAHDETGPQPLFALYRMTQAEPLLASARAALASHASVVQWHREIGACAADFSGRSAAFHNLNTPQDFRDCERAHDEY